MPVFDRIDLEKSSKEHGFIRDPFEKVLRITRILDYMNSQPYLRQHFVLKGGTAINLTIFDLPRLSVDIDMDFIPDYPADEIKGQRANAGKILQHYMESEGYRLRRDSRISHSLDGFHFSYQNAAGNTDMLKIELNYSLRSHILPPQRRVILTNAFGERFLVQAVDPLEIYAAKANALLSRAAARDLYDFDNMISNHMFAEQRDLLRKGIIFYHTISADEVYPEFNTSMIDTITMAKVKRDLLPMLRNRGKYDLDAQKDRAKEFLTDLMQLNEREKDYLVCFSNKEYRPELLFDDEDILERIRNHPMALWKCQ